MSSPIVALALYRLRLGLDRVGVGPTRPPVGWACDVDASGGSPSCRRPDQLELERVAVPEAGPGQALLRVRAAALTRDELEWPVDRLPAIPSYELSGVVAALGSGVEGVAVGDEVFGMTAVDRDGVAAEYAAIPVEMLAPKPRALSHVEAAAVPLAALSAWRGLFDHSRLAQGERVLIHGATGGVGQFATLPRGLRGAIDDRGDLGERDTNMSCNTKAAAPPDPASRARLQRDADGIRTGPRVRGAVRQWVNDRLRHVRPELVLATGLARSQHVEADPRCDRRQPAAEVLHLALVGTAQAKPRFLHGVVGLAH
jgi:hypothetical protein